MRVIVFLVCSFFSLITLAQEMVYLQTGRPFPLEQNNAFRSVGKPLGIAFKYDGGDVYNESVHGSIDAYNAEILKTVRRQNPQVTFDWILKEVEKEIKQQQELKVLVENAIDYRTWKHKEMNSSFLLYEPFKKNVYNVYRIYPVRTENGQYYKVGQVFRCNVKRKKVRNIKLSSDQLPFIFPENGIQ